ncbi:MAG: large conductance mechanosensitive channel protein MscL, partial [Planctomycetales bacterium]|nr:large conductance mechanosensitive channel protein MscL [Planctomycetales bacterium]
KDVIMPPIGKAMSGVDFSSLAYVLQSADPANNKEAITISYGVFINAVINFLVVAFAVFMLVKGINTARKRLEGEQEAATPPEPSDEVKLLTQIRDSLAHRA